MRNGIDREDALMTTLAYPYSLGNLTRVTAPSGRAVSLIEAKQQLRIEHVDEDPYIGSLIDAATAFCEQEIDGHRQFLSATYELPVSDWWEGPLVFPRPPLSSVTSLKYYDVNGVEQTLGTSIYQVKTPWRQPGYLIRGVDQDWPSLENSEREYPVTIRFVAGYGAASAIPATIKQAILLLVGHWYLNRSGTLIGSISKELEFSVSALLRSESWGHYS